MDVLSGYLRFIQDFCRQSPNYKTTLNFFFQIFVVSLKLLLLECTAENLIKNYIVKGIIKAITRWKSINLL